MIEKITVEFLKEQNACGSGVYWFRAQNESDPFKVLESLASGDHWSWCNWLLTRLMTHKQKVQLAVFAAEQVIQFFEKKYPNDDRPRKAIEAAKEWIKDPSEETKGKAVEARRAAYADAATDAATDADAYADAAAAAYAAAYAADAVGVGGGVAAAYAAAYAADAATDAATYAATYAAAAAKNKMRRLILDFGISLLKGDEK